MTGAPASSDGADLGGVLDDVVRYIDRFMAMRDEQLDAVALWTAHTHCATQFDVCAYLFITSPAKRCGKTLLIDILEGLVLTGRSTANISPAALYRMIDEVRPTLMFDEVDTIFTKGGKPDPNRSDLTGIINAGFRKGRVTYRMGGPNMRTLETFDAFGPKALGGIGACLPDATADRTIPVVLERKDRNVVKERYRIRIQEDEVKELHDRLADAVAQHPDVGEAWPQLPTCLNDRQQDIWEPLLALADVAGGTWPARARRAAESLHKTQDDTGNLTTKLLLDLRDIFVVKDEMSTVINRVEKLLTKDIVFRLNQMDESPWPDMNARNGISSTQLARMLKTYGISSAPMRVGPTDRGRGFTFDSLLVAFSRYLPDDDVDTDDIDANAQVDAVNTSAPGAVDAAVDVPDLGFLHVVNGVNTVSADQPRAATR